MRGLQIPDPKDRNRTKPVSDVNKKKIRIYGKKERCYGKQSKNGGGGEGGNYIPQEEVPQFVRPLLLSSLCPRPRHEGVWEGQRYRSTISNSVLDGGE
jgi:hypothetical protein